MEEIAHVKEITTDRYTMKLTIDQFNKRVRVEDYRGHTESCLQIAVDAAQEIQAEKLIVKARAGDVQKLIAEGFVYEASIDRFYRGSDCFFMAKFYQNERRNSVNWEEGDRILDSVTTLKKKGSPAVPPHDYEIRKATIDDAKKLAALYETVFEIYPTPMNNPDYITECMKKGTVFYVYTYEKEIVSAASAEIDMNEFNAEITDCATLAAHRQFGLMRRLIEALEDDLRKEQIFCLYSIARSLSYGMNAAFYGLGYTYKGRLANNCYIFDKLEDMNMWVKTC